VTIIGFLHTASVHEATFARLVAERNRSVAVVQITRPELLDRARSHGLDDPELLADIDAALGELDAAGVGVTVCTCSTIGGLAERTALVGQVRVLRVDRPMARLAVDRGGRIAVVAAVESTLAPTIELLKEEATAAQALVDIELKPCLDAWSLFELGNFEAYLRAIADHVDALPVEFSTVVLAQASMMGAVAFMATPARVLCSPQSAVDEAVRSAGSVQPWSDVCESGS
jgi:hypothetical protein